MLALTFDRNIPAYALVKAAGGRPSVATSPLALLHLEDIEPPRLPGPGWQFVHPLVHAAVYEAIPPARRSLRHGAAARLLAADAASPDRVALRSSHRYEGTSISYQFDGVVSAGQIAGTVDLAEYGKAQFTARRHEG